MRVLKISDNKTNRANIEYIQQKINSIKELKCECNIITGNLRVVLVLSCEEMNYTLFKKNLIDILAEVICVSYKYKQFNKNISTTGINSVERELLLSAIIAADFDDDKRYVCAKMAIEEEFAFDGFFNFRLQRLLRKWDEISGYIPNYFSSEDLKDFLNYLINEKKGRKILIENENVYDSHRRRLERTRLIPRGKEDSLLKEIILSGAGEVFVIGKINKEDFKWLNKYYGKKILIL